jgi:hypothetical protein
MRLRRLLGRRLQGFPARLRPPFLMQKVAVDFTARPRAPVAQSGGVPCAGELGLIQRLLATLARASDRQLVLVLGAVLFVLAAWPVLLVQVPPFQDLPNHLAAVTIIRHPERYPEFVFNGFFKTNSALFTWLLVVGGVLGTRMASKLFILLVLGLGAVSLPSFVLSFAGRRRMVVSLFFVWPLVHNWFVSTGMLDFALGIPLATFLLVGLNAQRQEPTLARAVGVALLGIVSWHAHVFPLLAVQMLVAIHVVTRRSWVERIAAARALALPLLPSAALVAASLWVHTTEPVGAMTGHVALGRMLPPWELFYNLWAEYFWSFTWLEIATLVPCLALGLWALYRWRDDVPFFGPVAFVALGALYFFTPYVATNWFHVNSRFIPFLWLAALVRLPERIPRLAQAVLGACALTYSAGMGVDYVRLDREWSRFTAGIGVVPEGAKLLPLVFRSKETSANTRSLLHAWGFYVTEKQTSAPLLFAHSRSFPLMYRSPPPPQFNHLVLESFAPSMAGPQWMCDLMRSGGVVLADCEGEWRARWADFWHDAEPQFDHVLMWYAPKEVMALVPPEYHVVLQRDELTILARR